MRQNLNIYEPTAAQVARALLGAGAYRIQAGVKDEASFEFTWKSGIKAPVYNNCRVLDGHPGPKAIIVKALGSAIKYSFPLANYVVGLAEGGITWSSPLALDINLPHAYVSKQMKAHGIQERVVGSPPKTGVKAVIVDDLVASGGTIKDALQLLIDEKNIQVVGVQTIVNWGFQKSRELFKEVGIRNCALVSYPQILTAAVERGMLTKAAAEELMKFYRNPEDHVWNLDALANPASIAEAI